MATALDKPAVNQPENVGGLEGAWHSLALGNVSYLDFSKGTKLDVDQAKTIAPILNTAQIDKHSITFGPSAAEKGMQLINNAGNA